MTFAAPLKVIVRLITYETDEETGRQTRVRTSRAGVYFGEIPLMTDKGRLSSMGPSGSSSASSTALPESFSNTKGKTIRETALLREDHPHRAPG
jgi:DNA-directed RNA polymerase subunit beta